MITREAVIACARGLLGVRFAHQGRHARHGLDCLGLLMVVAEQLQLRFEGMDAGLLDRQDYGSRPDAAALRAQLERWLVPCGEVEPGNVVLLAVHGEPQHLALLSDYPKEEECGMIHAYAPARKVVEHRYDTHWREATRGIYRLPQISS